MTRTHITTVAILCCACALTVSTAAPAQPAPALLQDSAFVIMQRYAAAWKGRQELVLAAPVVVAVSVRGEMGGDFLVTLSNESGASLRTGVTERYDIRFALDVEFLRRLDRNELNALTAMGQARSSDPIPLVPSPGPDFAKRSDAALLFRRVAFHFWNRAWPEVVGFDEPAARQVHGGNAVVLAYDEQFRSAWYQLKPGMHINADPKDQTNDHPQLVIVTKGAFNARLDGMQRVLAEGEAVLIPPGMRHEFWAADDQRGEFIFVAFGKGA